MQEPATAPPESTGRVVNPNPPSAILDSVVATGSRGIERKDPKRAVMALEMLCGGCGYREVELVTGLKFDTLLGLRSRHEPAIHVRRKQLAADGFKLAEGLKLLVLEKMTRLAEDPKALAKVNIRDLVVGYGVAVDKGMLALDGNRVTIEHVSKRPTLADAQAAIDEARAVLQKGAIDI